MRVLVVCSGNKGEASPFVREQCEQLENAGCDVSLFLVRGKGWRGYLSNRSSLVSAIRDFQPDIVHAHSGMSALLSGLQRKVPVVATFHGSDVNVPKLRFFTRLAILLTQAHIVVSEDMKRKLNRSDIHVLPCAVDTAVFRPSEMTQARRLMGWNMHDRYILFSSSFSNTVKNAPLAHAAVAALNDSSIHLIELSNKTRAEVAAMLNACDVALMTSFSEGSPQFIKEAMACGTPVVSTPVGDVAELSSNVAGHFLVEFDAAKLANALHEAMQYRSISHLTNGPEMIETRGLFPAAVAAKLVRLYQSILKR
jgi:teichuronic acid biosynthesis glycosyltransferase TuaC